jgi:D-arabinose 1-dehydrogenase-like Zn-dependent alcohol dehydrogenase
MIKPTDAIIRMSATCVCGSDLWPYRGAENKTYPQIEVIKANEINEAWRKVVNKGARYKYVIDVATI